MNVTIIGGGNLGTALALGLKDAYPGHSITVTKRRVEQITYLMDQGIAVSTDNIASVEKAEVVILAIKPYQIAKVLKEIDEKLSGKIVVSLATGVGLEEMRKSISSNCKIGRAMPNTALRLRQSLTCMVMEEGSEDNARQKVNSIFEAVGEVIWIDEKLFDAATVLGACGIAYVMRFIRGMMQGGIQIGFDADTALKIASQTVLGASTILKEEGTHPESEVDKVTTPRGCTIAGLNEMEHQGFSSALIKGIQYSFAEIENMKQPE